MKSRRCWAWYPEILATRKDLTALIRGERDSAPALGLAQISDR